MQRNLDVGDESTTFHLARPASGAGAQSTRRWGMQRALVPSVLLVLASCQAGGGTPEPASRPVSASPSTPEPQVIELVAEDFAFGTDTLHAVAGRPIVIHFRNNDDNIKHNFTLWRDDSRSGDKLFHGELLEGVGVIDYPVGLLEAGEYYFECFPHLALMNGHLVVEDG